MPYNPLLHTLIAKPLATSQGGPTDARSYYFDEVLEVYRPYVSTNEVLEYLVVEDDRTGNFPIWINSTGVLEADGTITGGEEVQWMFLAGTGPANLVEFGAGGVKQFATAGDFPMPGKPGLVYIATGDGSQYYWNGAAYEQLTSVHVLANLAAFPAVGNAGYLYIAKDTGAQYYWNGAAYIVLSGGPGSFIQNQVATAQTASFWIAGTARSATVRLSAQTVDPAITDGSLAFRSDLGKLRVSLAGAWQNILTENAAQLGYIQNQNALAQVASFWIDGTARSSTVRLAAQTVDPAIVDGSLAFRSDLGKIRVALAGAWKNLATEDQLPAAGAFIQNQNAAAQAASFFINGSGKIEGGLTVYRLQGGFPALDIIDPATGLISVRFNVEGAARIGNRLLIGADPNPTGAPNSFPLEITGNNNGQNPAIVNGFAFGWNRLGGAGEADLIWGSNAGSSGHLDFAYWNGVTYQASRATLSPAGVFSAAVLAAFGVTVDPAVVNGGIAYRSDLQKFRAGINGQWKNLATEDQTGYNASRLVLVDNTHAAATDVRTGISKYNQAVPFVTIQAAVNVLTSGDTLRIANGGYAESVAANIGGLYRIVYENAVHQTANTALTWTARDGGGLVITLRNSYVFTTGNAGDLTAQQAMRLAGEGSGTVFLIGDPTSLVECLNGAALQVQSTQVPKLQGVAFKSTNYYGAIAANFQGVATDCRFTSTNSVGCYNFQLNRCYVKGATNGLELPGNLRPSYLKCQDCYIEGTTGGAVAGGSSGGPDDGIGGFMKNCTTKSEGEAVHIGAGGAFDHKLYFERCVFELGATAPAAIFYPQVGDASSVLDIYACRSSKAMVAAPPAYQYNDLQNLVDPFTKAKSF